MQFFLYSWQLRHLRIGLGIPLSWINGEDSKWSFSRISLANFHVSVLLLRFCANHKASLFFPSVALVECDHLVRSWPREGQLVKYRVSGPRSAGLGRAKVVWQVVGGRTDWFRWARSGLQYVDGWTSVSLLDHGQPRDHTVKLPLKTIIHSPQSQLSPTPVSVSISTESACLTRV